MNKRRDRLSAAADRDDQSSVAELSPDEQFEDESEYNDPRDTEEGTPSTDSPQVGMTI